MALHGTILEPPQPIARPGGAPSRGTGGISKVYEVREFVRLKPDDNLTPVRHYRTVYHADGRISKETLSVEDLLEKTIGAFNGYTYRSAGILKGFFDDPGKAEECARAIAAHHDRKAEVCGTEITIAM